jgi:hypothetical protein
LTRGPKKGEVLGKNFASDTKGKSGSELWTFFEKHFSDDARAVGEDDAERANESAALKLRLEAAENESAALKLQLEAAEARAATAEARVAFLEKEQLSRARDDTLCFPCFFLRSK